MNYTFTCGNCQLDFTVQGKNLINKETLTCPNCDNKISKATLNKLQSLQSTFKECKSLNDSGLGVKIEGFLKCTKVKVSQKPAGL